MRFLIACTGFSLVTLACDSETQNCNNAGCQSGVTIELDDAPEHAAHYDVQISYAVADENVFAFECRFDLPGTASSADDDAGPGNADADPKAGSMGCRQTAGKPVELELTPTEGGGPVLGLRDTPETVRILVVRGYRTIHADSFAPKYEKLDPNGPHCGPHCSLATHHIDLVTGMTKDITLPKGRI